MPRLRPDRIEYLDQPLERHIGMPKRIQIHLACFSEDIREGSGWIDRRPQHQRVHEHPHEIIQRTLAATCDRSTDRDIVRARQPRQQHSQR
ncbi:hypothetical protein MLGJGCBP_03962 [Rhodococcus sp. T7]|nr:hypothetical protein MLGJGCBP_03962 [Rhodococcus sp. T7]